MPWCVSSGAPALSSGGLEVAHGAYVRLLSLDEPGAVELPRLFCSRPQPCGGPTVCGARRTCARTPDTPRFTNLAAARTPERVVAKQAARKL